MTQLYYRRNGMTFKIERVRPHGWELSACGLEPDATWTYLSLWKTKRDAIEAMEFFVPC